MKTSSGCAVLQHPKEGSYIGAEPTVTTDICTVCTDLNFYCSKHRSHHNYSPNTLQTCWCL